MGITYSYKLTTGLEVTYEQKEKEELEDMAKSEKEKMERANKEEYGSEIHWTEGNLWLPFHKAVIKYFKLEGHVTDEF